MKITKQQLKQIIKEELKNVMQELGPSRATERRIDAVTDHPRGAMRRKKTIENIPGEVMPADHPYVIDGACEEGELVTDCMKKHPWD
jgi:hypothetical protein